MRLVIPGHEIHAMAVRLLHLQIDYCELWMIKINNRILALSFFIIIYFAILLIPYIFRFYDVPDFEDPAEWGAIGDYFGGLLNPVMSAVTLIFVACTYLSQKEEIKRLTKLADEAEKNRDEDSARQREISDESNRISMQSARISVKSREIEFYYDEIKRA